MTSKEMIINLYEKGHAVNYIVKKIYNDLNRGFFIDIKINKYIDKNNYKDMNYCRNMVESVILDYISTSKETKFPL